jgi:hypothetical protein
VTFQSEATRQARCRDGSPHDRRLKDLEFPDEHAIPVRDTQARLELAAAVVKMLDTADDVPKSAPVPPMTAP